MDENTASQWTQPDHEITEEEIRAYALNEYQRRYDAALTCTSIDAEFRARTERALKCARYLARMIATFVKYSENFEEFSVAKEQLEILRGHAAVLSYRLFETKEKLLTVTDADDEAEATADLALKCANHYYRIIKTIRAAESSKKKEVAAQAQLNQALLDSGDNVLRQRERMGEIPYYPVIPYPPFEAPADEPVPFPPKAAQAIEAIPPEQLIPTPDGRLIVPEGYINEEGVDLTHAETLDPKKMEVTYRYGNEPPITWKYWQRKTDRDAMPEPLLKYYRRLAQQYTQQLLE